MSFNVTIIMRLDECYEILGIKPGVSEEEIKKAYRRKSLIHHPDRNMNSNDSTEMFKKINEAYEIICNRKVKSEESDIFGDGAMNLDAFMKMFTDMGSHPSFAQHIGKQLEKPMPIIKRIEISLEQVYNGCMIPIQITRNIKLNGESREETETLYVTIPKGVDTNEIIVFREKGHKVGDYPGGDVKVFISVQDHDVFKRSGLNIIYKSDITLKDALCGVNFEFTHLSGKQYKINNSSGKNVIHPGYRKVVPGLGLQREGHTGDLFIEFNVMFPERLNQEQISVLSKTL